MSASIRRCERRRNNSRRTVGAAASVLAASVAVFGSSIGSGGVVGVDAFTTLSPSLTGRSSCTHAMTMPPRMTARRRRVPMVARGDLVTDDDDDHVVRSVRHIATPSSTSSSLPRLSRRQELSLLRHMRDHPSHSEESQSARQLLLVHNLPLVQSIVTKLMRSRGMGAVGKMEGSVSQHQLHQNQMSLAREDLVHEGTIGLAEAIDKYDLAYAQTDEVELGGGLEGGGVARLGTYATYWIRARVLRAMQRGEHSLLRFPEHAVQASHRLVKAARDMGLAWDDVAMLAEQQNDSAHETDRDAGVVGDGSMTDFVLQSKLREKLRAAAGIATDGLFRDAVRVRSMSRASSTTQLEPWMLYPSISSDPATTATDGIAIDDDLLGQEHIVETLSKFLVPREVEVLSLRYGLVAPSLSSEVSSDVANEANLQSQPAVRTRAVYRDYEAEAEEELFGPGGMLLHYSATPKSEDDIKSPSKASIGQVVTQAASASTSSSRPGLSPSPSLLPFREIGRRMEFSAEYCRRTCSAALVKLARAAEEGRLAESDFLLGW
ncbi:hypothetical protein ACHAXH_005179 [Discostella pseudostelligera]